MRIGPDSKDTWHLVDMWQGNLTLATWGTYTEDYPLGVHDWNVTVDRALCNLPIGQ